MSTDSFVEYIVDTALSAGVGWVLAAGLMFELGWFFPRIGSAWLESAGPAGAVIGIAISTALYLQSKQ